MKRCFRCHRRIWILSTRFCVDALHGCEWVPMCRTCTDVLLGRRDG